MAMSVAELAHMEHGTQQSSNQTYRIVPCRCSPLHASSPRIMQTSEEQGCVSDCGLQLSGRWGGGRYPRQLSAFATAFVTGLGATCRTQAADRGGGLGRTGGEMLQEHPGSNDPWLRVFRALRCSSAGGRRTQAHPRAEVRQAPAQRH